jgi:hypothetical protein
MAFLSEEHLTLAAAVGAQVFAEQVDAFERQSEVRSHIIAE